MKHLSILAIAALAMISCSNTSVKEVNLQSQTDSINYAIGLMNGLAIRQQAMQEDSSKAVVKEFIKTLEKTYKSEVKLSDGEEVAHNFGMAAKNYVTSGLAENKALVMNGKIFFQGLVNAFYEDTTVMTAEEAGPYFQQTYMSTMNQDAATEKGNLGACPKSAKTIVLNTMMDSANYAFGFMTGNEIKMYVLDSDSACTTDDFIKALNKTLKQKARNAQMVGIAENIGKAIREQENEGLLGINGLETNFDLIKQGFINGLNGKEIHFTNVEARQYVTQAVQEIQGAAARAEGENFLTENALRDEVKTTESGLQYEVLVQGKGKMPKATDKVRVHYEGKLVDGTIFDSSYERGEPISFELGGVIAGWTEGLQLMPVGSTYMLYIPYNLGYGETGAGRQIPPYATLIFKVELLGIE